MKGKKRQLEDFSVDDFIAEGLDSESDGDEDETEVNDAGEGEPISKMKDTKKNQLEDAIAGGLDSESDGEDESEDETEIKDAGEGEPISKMKDPKEKGKEGRMAQHKQALKKLEENDPEFYDFLKKEDQTLLNFADSDISEDDDNDDDDVESDDEGVGKMEIAPVHYDIEEDEDEEGEDIEGDKKKSKKAAKKADKEKKNKKEKKRKEELFHKPDLKEKLEVHSDEEDLEEEEDDEEEEENQEGQIKVTLTMIERWDAKMQSGSIGAFKDIVRALSAAVCHIQKKSSPKNIKFYIKGSSTFNAIVTLCLKRAYPLLQSFLEIDEQAVKRMMLPSAAKNWNKVGIAVKSYLVQLMQLIKGITDPKLVAALLRHVHKMVPYFACHAQIASKLVTYLVEWWSTSEETVRILSFVCLFSLTRHMKNAKLDFILKKMYLSYVRNSRFTSPNTLPVIMFMQHSLTEMFALDTKVTYQHAFVYIRQLAIHLRNAMTIKKKDSYQSVYNWQYVHCIHLWCRVLGTLHQDDNLRPLIYPLVQTSVGVIKLIPAGKYYPIRFHVIRSLNTLSAATGVFIPLLPFLTEIFDITDFNKKHASMSFKPINFAVILRLSKAQIMEKGFREGVIDQIYDLILEVCNTHCHTIGFPELVLPAIVKMKEFVKTCKVANFTRQIKQLLDKIQENCNDIEKRRSTATFGIADNGAVKAWETKYLIEGPPISKYCKTYRNLREKELRMAEAARDVSVEEIGSMTMTTKKRKAFEFIQRDHSKKELKELFHGDSDSEDDLLVRAERRQEKLDSGKKVFALVRADMDDDEDGFSDESDEGGDDEEDEEELMDAEKFKEQKTEIFREMANVKDIVEDFDMSEEEKTEVIKKKKTTTNKEKKVVPEGKMKRKVPEGKMKRNAPEGKKRRNAPEGKMRKNAPQGKMRKSKGGVKPRKKQKLVK